MEPRARRVEIVEATRPVLPRHVKLRHDTTRGRWVLLAPERVLAPDDIAIEVLQLCDGARSVIDLVDELACKYAADKAEISRDVIAMLQDLADKGFLSEVRESSAS